VFSGAGLLVLVSVVARWEFLHHRAADLDPADHHDLGAGSSFSTCSTSRCCCCRSAADRKLDRLPHPGLGAIFTLVIVFVTACSRPISSARDWLQLWNDVLHRIPVVNSIYSSVKQDLRHAVLSSGQAIQGRRCWCNGRTKACGRSPSKPGRRAGTSPTTSRPILSVYVPTTPNPTGGYFVVVARKDVIGARQTVDQALKYVISMA